MRNVDSQEQEIQIVFLPCFLFSSKPNESNRLVCLVGYPLDGGQPCGVHQERMPGVCLTGNRGVWNDRLGTLGLCGEVSPPGAARTDASLWEQRMERQPVQPGLLLPLQWGEE